MHGGNGIGRNTSIAWDAYAPWNSQNQATSGSSSLGAGSFVRNGLPSQMGSSSSNQSLTRQVAAMFRELSKYSISDQMNFLGHWQRDPQVQSAGLGQVIEYGLVSAIWIPGEPQKMADWLDRYSNGSLPNSTMNAAMSAQAIADVFGSAQNAAGSSLPLRNAQRPENSSVDAQAHASSMPIETAATDAAHDASRSTKSKYGDCRDKLYNYLINYHDEHGSKPSLKDALKYSGSIYKNATAGLSAVRELLCLGMSPKLRNDLLTLIQEAIVDGRIFDSFRIQFSKAAGQELYSRTVVSQLFAAAEEFQKNGGDPSTLTLQDLRPHIPESSQDIFDALMQAAVSGMQRVRANDHAAAISQDDHRDLPHDGDRLSDAHLGGKIMIVRDQ